MERALRLFYSIMSRTVVERRSWIVEEEFPSLPRALEGDTKLGVGEQQHFPLWDLLHLRPDSSERVTKWKRLLRESRKEEATKRSFE